MAFYSPFGRSIPSYYSSPYASPYNYGDYSYERALAAERQRQREEERAYRLALEREQREYEAELNRRRYIEQLRKQQAEREYVAALQRQLQEAEAKRTRKSRYPGGHRQRVYSIPIRPLPVPSDDEPEDVEEALDVDSTMAPTVVEVTHNDQKSAQPEERIEEPSSATQEPRSTTLTSEEIENAATTLQRHYRAHVRRRDALSSLSSLEEQLAKARSSLSLPDQLVFQSGDKPVLAYSSTNASFLAYEDSLVKLLSKIDEVQSGGDATIKRARKELVRKVETELDQLDRKKMNDFEKSSSSLSSAATVDDDVSRQDNFRADEEVDEEKFVSAPTSSDDSPKVEEPSITENDKKEDPQQEGRQTFSPPSPPSSSDSSDEEDDEFVDLEPLFGSSPSLGETFSS